MVLMETPVCNFGEPAIEFSLKNIDGEVLSLQQCQGENGTVIMFISNHCPYVKAIQTQLVTDAHTMAEFGVNCVAIMPNDSVNYPDDSFENMQRIATEFNYPFPFLIDETQAVTREYDAICTPDFFGYNKHLQLQYRGRLNATTPANRSPAENTPELVNAMKQIAETDNGPEKQTPSMGCSIKWRN